MNPSRYASSFLFGRIIIIVLNFVAFFALPVFALDGDVRIHDPYVFQLPSSAGTNPRENACQE